MSRSTFSSSASVLLLGLLLNPAWAQSVPEIGPLPLGRSDLPQASTGSTLAPGVRHFHVRRGEVDKTRNWTLNSAVLTTPRQVADAKKCFAALGLKPGATAFQLGGATAQDYQVLAAGSYPSRAAAQVVAGRAKAAKCSVFPRHAAQEAVNNAGPWEFDIVELQPGQGAMLSAVTGTQGPNLRRQVTTLAKSAGALAAVNGGFFVMEEEDGFPGQPSGISILEGKVNSGPVTARPAVLIKEGGPAPVSIVRSVDLSTYLLWQDGTRTPVDGVNRKPGLVRDCGRDARDEPIHDHTCAYPDDIVYFPAGSGFAAAAAQFAPSVSRFALAADGTVRKLAAGTAPQAGEASLAVTAGSKRLAQIDTLVAARQHADFKAESKIADLLAHQTRVVNGGPTLLSAGQEVRDEVGEGWGIAVVDDPKHDMLIHDWVNRREPRTALGIKDDGTVVLLTVDGHRHARSVGMTIDEVRKVMKALGARDAINLDGGGSTAMVLGGRLVNLPSDAGGERAVGDAVVIVPAKDATK